MPARIKNDFVGWFESHVVKRMKDFLSANSQDPEIQQVLESQQVKVPNAFMTSFVTLFKRLEEEEFPPVDIFNPNPKPKVKKAERPSKNFEEIRETNVSRKSDTSSHDAVSCDFDGELVGWVDIVQNEYPDFDFPTDEEERHMYHSSLYPRLQKAVKSFLARESLSKFNFHREKLIPKNLSEAFLSFFKTEVIDKDLPPPQQDMPWREVLKLYYPSFEPPLHQLSASYVETLEGIEDFLERECSPGELKQQAGNPRRKKIPARLIPAFVSWFRRFDRIDDSSDSDDDDTSSDDSGMIC